VEVPDRCCKLNCSLCSPQTDGYIAGFDLNVMLCFDLNVMLCVGSSFCDSRVLMVACSSVVTLLRVATRLEIMPNSKSIGAIYYSYFLLC
jgi:hypothetical protein